mgnify:CR=1 FL=1
MDGRLVTTMSIATTIVRENHEGDSSSFIVHHQLLTITSYRNVFGVFNYFTWKWNCKSASITCFRPNDPLKDKDLPTICSLMYWAMFSSFRSSTMSFSPLGNSSFAVGNIIDLSTLEPPASRTAFAQLTFEAWCSSTTTELHAFSDADDDGGAALTSGDEALGASAVGEDDSRLSISLVYDDDPR